MKKVLSLVVTLVLVIAFAVPAAAATLDAYGVTWDAVGGASLDNGKIVIDIPANAGMGTDGAYMTLKDQKNYTISLSMRFLPKADHLQAGIFLYCNEGKFAKFTRTYSGKNMFEFYGTEGFLSDGTSIDDPMTDKELVYLKLENAEGAFTAYYSADGKAWTTIGSYTNNAGEDIKIGLLGASWTTATGKAVIESFDIKYRDIQEEVTAPKEEAGTEEDSSTDAVPEEASNPKTADSGIVVPLVLAVVSAVSGLSVAARRKK